MIHFMRNFGGENMKYVVILIAIVLLIFLFMSYMLADYIKPLKKVLLQNRVALSPKGLYYLGFR